MTELATDAFRRLGPGDAIPNGFVVPYYLEDRKRRIAVARVNDRLYAFDDLCTCARRRALSPGVCSRGRRSCASATAHASTSPREQCSTARPRRHSACTTCRRSTAALPSGLDAPTRFRSPTAPSFGSRRLIRVFTSAGASAGAVARRSEMARLRYARSVGEHSRPPQAAARLPLDIHMDLATTHTVKSQPKSRAGDRLAKRPTASTHVDGSPRWNRSMTR